MKKEKKPETFPWKKVFVIAVGVLFVFMMVLSAMGTSWLQSFRTVAANDTVAIDFTLNDALGQAVLTTDQNLYRTDTLRGRLVFLTGPLILRAGYVGNPAITGVDAVNYYLGGSDEIMRFGLLGQELDELDVSVLGMKTGEKKTISFTFSDPLTISMMDYEFAAMGGNFTTSSVGDLIPLGLSETPLVSGLDEYNNTPQNAVWRIGTVVNKTADTIDVLHRYPSAVIMVKEFS